MPPMADHCQKERRISALTRQGLNYPQRPCRFDEKKSRLFRPESVLQAIMQDHCVVQLEVRKSRLAPELLQNCLAVPASVHKYRAKVRGRTYLMCTYTIQGGI